MHTNGFVEISTPKLIGGKSESGSEVFQTDYYGQKASLAQSPQFHKQMAVMGDFDKVYEVGPVFRAEDSNTNRHLCEFTGFDMEMRLQNHYFEVLDELETLFQHTFNSVRENHSNLLDIIHKTFGTQSLLIPNNIPRIHFKDAAKLLQKNGYDQNEFEDFSTETEKALGKLFENE